MVPSPSLHHNSSITCFTSLGLTTTSPHNTKKHSIHYRKIALFATVPNTTKTTLIRYLHDMYMDSCSVKHLTTTNIITHGLVASYRARFDGGDEKIRQTHHFMHAGTNPGVGGVNGDNDVTIDHGGRIHFYNSSNSHKHC